MGGIRAVALTDLVQFLIIIFFIPLIAVYALDAAGGLEIVVRKSFITKEGFDHSDVLNLSLLFVLASIGNFSPVMVHRLLLSRDLKKLSDSLKLSALIEVPTSFIIAIVGGAAFVIHYSNNPSQASLSLIETILPVGLKGFAVAGMFAVIMSTIDSFINTGSILVVEDLYKPLMKKYVKVNEVVLAKFSGAGIGLLGLFISTQFKNIFDVFIFSQELWLPLTLIPIYVTIFGVKTERKAFIKNGLITLTVFYAIKLTFHVSLPATIFALCVSFFLFYRQVLFQKITQNIYCFKRAEIFKKIALLWHGTRRFFYKDLDNQIFPLSNSSEVIQAYGILSFFLNFLGFFIFLDTATSMNGLRFVTTVISLTYMLITVFQTREKYFFMHTANILYYFAGVFIPWILYFSNPQEGALLIPMMLTSIALLITPLKDQMFFMSAFVLGFWVFGRFDSLVEFQKLLINIGTVLLCVAIFGCLMRRFIESRIRQLYLVSKNIAHEINTPLALISLSTGAIQKEMDEEKSHSIDRHLTVTLKAVQRISNFTRLSLMTAKDTMFKAPLEKINLKACVLESVQDYPFSAGQQKIITVEETKDSAIAVLANADLVRAVITNLIKNAIEAMGDRAPEQQKITVTIKADLFYQEVLLTIQDNGAGIAADKLTKIFDPLYSTKAHGTGIGLSFCKGAMEYMKGSITCSSKVKSGTEFVLRFRYITE